MILKNPERERDHIYNIAKEERKGSGMGGEVTPDGEISDSHIHPCSQEVARMNTSAC